MTKLIRLLNIPLILAISILAVKCNSNSEENTETVVATDSSMMDKKMSTDVVTPGDTTSLNRIDTTSTIKPNPAKKGKKGSVTVAMGENKTSANPDMKDSEGYYTGVYPSYPGGQKALEDFFAKNIIYPQDATDNGIEGTVNINFAVDESGKISAIKTTNSAIGYGIEDEALRVFKQMPSWKPGSLKGKNVKTKYSLPVKFQLAE
ncbi:MAG: energy transducer TonB [Bacteroidota bacterium]